MGFKELFESYDKKIRKSHFKNLLAIAMADLKMENIEIDYLFKLAKRCYMTSDEVQHVIDNPGSVGFHPPRTDWERFNQIYDLVVVMLADDQIDYRELNLCKTFAMKLGFSTEIVDKLINYMIEQALQGATIDYIIQKFSTDN